MLNFRKFIVLALLLNPCLGSAGSIVKKRDFCGAGGQLLAKGISKNFSHDTNLQSVILESDFYAEVFGKCKGSKFEGENLILSFEGGEAKIKIDFDGLGKIQNLQFLEGNSYDDSFDKIRRDFSSLVPNLGIWISQDGEEAFSKEGEKAFDSGRARYIPLLSQLEGFTSKNPKLHSEVVNLYNPPSATNSSFMGQFPNGSPTTIETLKNMVLFYEDEVAADTLLKVVDKNALDQMEGSRKYYLSNAEKKLINLSGENGYKLPNGKVLKSEELSWNFSPKLLCSRLQLMISDTALFRRGSISEENHKNETLFYSWGDGKVQITKIGKGTSKYKSFCYSFSGNAGPGKNWDLIYSQIYNSIQRLDKILLK